MISYIRSSPAGMTETARPVVADPLATGALAPQSAPPSPRGLCRSARSILDTPSIADLQYGYELSLCQYCNRW
jgi:hypothetical protein